MSEFIDSIFKHKNPILLVNPMSSLKVFKISDRIICLMDLAETSRLSLTWLQIFEMNVSFTLLTKYAPLIMVLPLQGDIVIGEALSVEVSDCEVTFWTTATTSSKASGSLQPSVSVIQF